MAKDERYRAGQRDNGRLICGAKTRTGAPCKKPPMENGRCRLHGGMAVRGPAHHMWKDGRRSKYLPLRLAERYQEALTDHELLSLRDEIALMDVRVNELLEELNEYAGQRTLQRVAKLNAELKEAWAQQDAVALRAAILGLDEAVQEAARGVETWQDVADFIERRRRLVDSENKRLNQLEQFITAQQANALVGALIGIIQNHVTDQHLLAAIAADVASIAYIESGS